MSRPRRKPGRERRLRQRLFEAGNTRCPICLSEFDRSDVMTGTKVTLEHAPPKSLGGAPICLTCTSCNNKASLIDHHALLSARARKDWKEGRGAPVVVNLFGHKRSFRYVPDDPNAPYPARKHLFRNGTIQLGQLPRREHLDANKGIGLEIPQRDDFEFVSMVKSAYLMVFSIMGVKGYNFAESAGLRSVREQIMHPKKKILGDKFLATVGFDSDDLGKVDRPVIYLCRAADGPFWIVPMWDDRAVVLPCGGTKPIDTLAIYPKKISIPPGSLAGWLSCKFNSSAAVGGTVKTKSGDPEYNLAELYSSPVPFNGKRWLYLVVFREMSDCVALPFCPENKLPGPNEINVIDMLSMHEVAGRKLDKTQLTAVNTGPRSNHCPPPRIPVEDK